VSIDETDLGGFAAGCPAQVTFTALPGKTFSGSVAQVMPVLVTANNVSSAQGLVALGGKNLPSAPALPIGMNASVTITCSQASNVLLAPAQAVYHLAGQPEYVYVLNAQGKPEKRPVVVGQTTATVAEIRSGLQAGEEVITTPIHQPVN
jgi:multidrug efflux pump subunit AcrA (membrane-fusion protein)